MQTRALEADEVFKLQTEKNEINKMSMSELGKALDGLSKYELSRFDIGPIDLLKPWTFDDHDRPVVYSAYGSMAILIVFWHWTRTKMQDEVWLKAKNISPKSPLK